jgi:hypothetical protein
MIRAAAIDLPLTPAPRCVTAGYGCDSVNEPVSPLKVRALHIRSGTGAITIVALDAYSLSPDMCREMCNLISRATLVPPAHVLIHATHAHHTPPTVATMAHDIDSPRATPDPEYCRQVVHQAEFAASSAAATTQPAELAITSLPPPEEAFADYEDGRSPLQLMAIRQVNGGPLITLILHGPVPPCIMGPAIKATGGDLPAALEERLQEHHRQPPLIYLLAPSGDYPACHDVPLGIDAMNALADDWARRIGEALDALDDRAYVSSTDLTGISETIQGLPTRRLPSVLNARVRLEDARDALRLAPDSATAIDRCRLQAAVDRAEGDLNIARAWGDNPAPPILDPYRTMQLQLIRIGALRIVGLQGQLYTDCVPFLTAGANGPLWVVGNANGDLQGYIPLPQEHGENPPACVPSPFAARGVPDMLEAARSLIKRSGQR